MKEPVGADFVEVVEVGDVVGGLLEALEDVPFEDVHLVILFTDHVRVEGVEGALGNFANLVAERLGNPVNDLLRIIPRNDFLLLQKKLLNRFHGVLVLLPDCLPDRRLVHGLTGLQT